MLVTFYDYFMNLYINDYDNMYIHVYKSYQTKSVGKIQLTNSSLKVMWTSLVQNQMEESANEATRVCDGKVGTISNREKTDRTSEEAIRQREIRKNNKENDQGSGSKCVNISGNGQQSACSIDSDATTGTSVTCTDTEAIGSHNQDKQVSEGSTNPFMNTIEKHNDQLVTRTEEADQTQSDKNESLPKRCVTSKNEGNSSEPKHTSTADSGTSTTGSNEQRVILLVVTGISCITM